jgi:hypothetical protein
VVYLRGSRGVHVDPWGSIRLQKGLMSLKEVVGADKQVSFITLFIFNCKFVLK